jgi:prolyl-tRNA synthetase
LRVDTMEGLVRFFKESIGFVITPWCGSADDEARVKQETTATTRVILDRALPAASSCAICGRPATSEVVWAKAY